MAGSESRPWMSATVKWAALALGSMFAVGLWLSLRPVPEFAVGSSLPPGKVAPQISVTWDCAVLLAPDGALWAWGGRLFGLEGNLPTRTLTDVPQRIGTDSDWVRVSANWVQTLALKADGSLWGWGWNTSGGLTTTPTNRVGNPRRIGGDNDWSDVKTGAGQVLALKRDGSLWTWGQNNYGQVGDGTTSNRFVPFQVTTNRQWKAIAAGHFNSYTIARDGTIWGWGLCPRGLGRGPDHLVPTLLDPGGNWVAISSTDYSLLALRNDGTLWVYGQNAGSIASAYATNYTGAFVQIGSETNWSAVWPGQRGFIGRQNDGSWWASDGDPRFAPLVQTGAVGNTRGLRRVPGEFDPLAIGLGNATVILTKDGALWSAGEQLGVPGRVTLMDRLQRLISRISGSTVGTQPSPIMDYHFRRIWQLPPPATNTALPAPTDH
jgi:trimeric autotransporter adhesin